MMIIIIITIIIRIMMMMVMMMIPSIENLGTTPDVVILSLSSSPGIQSSFGCSNAELGSYLNLLVLVLVLVLILVLILN